MCVSGGGIKPELDLGLAAEIISYLLDVESSSPRIGLDDAQWPKAQAARAQCF